MKIQLHQVSFSYSSEPFLKDIHLQMSNQDGCIVLSGRNGVGKSTLLNIVSEQLPYTGDIIKDDVHMLFLPYQDPLLENNSVLDNLAFFYRIFHRRAINFKEPRIVDLLHSLSIHYLEQKVSLCSSGERKKVALACLLLSDANVYLLDEPFVAIDYQSVNELIALINRFKQEALFIITTHSFGLAERFCDRLLVMAEGGIVVDTKDKQVIHTYFEKSSL